MDVQLICGVENRARLQKELEEKGFVIKDKAAFIFYEANFSAKKFIFAQDARQAISMLKFEDILYFESFDGETFAVTFDGKYTVREKLYELEEQLVLRDFCRISKSDIVNLVRIVKIIPWIGCKLLLELENGDRVTVTRTYYDDFKKRIGL
ncbi:MAG: LytTR family transcriptional regulator [Spirochaetia bacterium]|jgi:DNA-binding LytR/AlgR family response regulator|nr:LytTR family transcriptional regulator [Spirochaetia bacterium]